MQLLRILYLKITQVLHKAFFNCLLKYDFLYIIIVI